MNIGILTINNPNQDGNYPLMNDLKMMIIILLN